MTIYQKLVLRLLSVILYRLLHPNLLDPELDEKHDNLIRETQREIIHE